MEDQDGDVTDGLDVVESFELVHIVTELMKRTIN
jgi:hypothetical protein